ncbi:hypothetical protein [Streptomyces cyanogenus]|uniref:Uncharacterized protein n=1 Tax=Streptomyces cyanogenus TaxID=80860 RepID=A0ABX7TID4_STRCY|nr:hypothetical protein [Streptomyces cyanogenus]QTD96217.1 hypothetical protein S1361_02605 [Streptomyces cyanogenus]
MTTATQPLAVLSLPEFHTLSQDQVRGITCVYDGAALSSKTAVDLGERRLRRVGGRVSWFPRACRRCALEQAMSALVTHSQSCEECVDDSNLCPTGTGLVRAVREARKVRR